MTSRQPSCTLNSLKGGNIYVQPPPEYYNERTIVMVCVGGALVVGEQPRYLMAMMNKEFLQKDTNRLLECQKKSSSAALPGGTATATSSEARRTTSTISFALCACITARAQLRRALQP